MTTSDAPNNVHELLALIDEQRATLARVREFANTALGFVHHDPEFAALVRAMGGHLLRKLDDHKAAT